MANSFAKPVVVWISDSDRERLMEIAERAGAPSERVGGNLLARMLTGAVADLAQQHEPAKAAKRAYSTPRSAEGTARARRR